MHNDAIQASFAELSTPLIADACLRLAIPLRVAPTGIRAVLEGGPLAGRVLPVRHYGSVDIFLEALGAATAGDLLVIDNGGRSDEGCIGDLTVLETQAAGLAGMILWGCHRDTAELIEIGFPVFSYGRCPAGPLRLDAREAEALHSARFGGFTVTREDVAFADGDGVLFAPYAQIEGLLATARDIWQRERRQAQAIRAGKTLREQFRFDDYLAARAATPGFSFREYLRAIGGAIEE